MYNILWLVVISSTISFIFGFIGGFTAEKMIKRTRSYEKNKVYLESLDLDNPNETLL